MAVYNAYVVEYKTGGSWSTIGDVQALTIRVGRRLATDQWQPSTASITLRYPTGFASPLPGLGIDTIVRVFAPGRSATQPTWTGRVSDLSVQLGIPWNAGTSTGNADYLEIQAEGEYARAGRLGDTEQWSGVTSSSVDTWFFSYWSFYNGIVSRLNHAATGYGATMYYPPTPAQLPDTVTKILNYTFLRVADGVAKKAAAGWYSAGSTDDPGVSLESPVLATTDIATVEFSDTTNDATHRTFDTFELDSLSDQYFTACAFDWYDSNVAPPVSKSILATAAGASSPVRQVYIQALPQGGLFTYPQQNADYWANAYDTAAMTPATLSASTAAQHTQNLDTLGFTNLELGYLITKAVAVEFRGQRYVCRIEGVTLTADLDATRVTYHLSATANTAWFIIGSADLGVLGQNRLGIY